MTLAQLLKALACNEKVSISIFNEDGKCLITFNAPGYEAIESDLAARTVKRVKVDTGITGGVSITIEDAKESGTETGNEENTGD